ncbi:MAG: hypothetical protein H7641_05245, partial [Candidatus Heimdallarchaeota archaeon]|nr:hypothetical protein [Candidatus Heimdallarchaeota archaeon]MCK4876967.1 hypothetical protein [Candidatus Heimdallarchaeota archaeon]
PIFDEIFVENEKKTEIQDVKQVFRTHSLKMIDSLPSINIDNYVVHMLKKGDYYAILYVNQDDEQSIARETGLTLFFEVLSRMKRELEIDKVTIKNLIDSIKWEF